MHLHRGSPGLQRPKRAPAKMLIIQRVRSNQATKLGFRQASVMLRVCRECGHQRRELKARRHKKQQIWEMSMFSSHTLIFCEIKTLAS